MLILFKREIKLIGRQRIIESPRLRLTKLNVRVLSFNFVDLDLNLASDNSVWDNLEVSLIRDHFPCGSLSIFKLSEIEHVLYI